MHYLLGHHAVDVLWDTARHQVDRDGADEVPAQGCVVLQTIAGAILGWGQESAWGQTLLSSTDMLSSETSCHFPPFSASFAPSATPVPTLLPASFPLWGPSLTTVVCEV